MDENKCVANKALADELAKRLKFIEKAKEQVLCQNYGIAIRLLNKVLCDPLKIYVSYYDDNKGQK